MSDILDIHANLHVPNNVSFDDHNISGDLVTYDFFPGEDSISQSVSDSSTSADIDNLISHRVFIPVRKSDRPHVSPVWKKDFVRTSSISGK